MPEKRKSDSDPQPIKKPLLGIPRWLSHPITISPHIVPTAHNQIDHPQWRLSSAIQKRLKENGITHFFPVQEAVLPVLMATKFSRVNPGDLCVAASTGSGKTLAYVVPVIETLSQRIVTRLRALILLPTRDLAIQVKNEFDRFAKGMDLKVGLMIGQTSFSQEQKILMNGHESLVDILVATPGRLMDHLKGTPGFTLNHLRFLIVDEADRLLNQSFQNWLEQVLQAVHPLEQKSEGTGYWGQHGFKTDEFGFPIHDAVTYRSCSEHDIQFTTPLQKLLFSATLTRNPGKIASLKLNDPKYICVKGIEKEDPVQDMEVDGDMGDIKVPSSREVSGQNDVTGGDSQTEILEPLPNTLPLISTPSDSQEPHLDESRYIAPVTLREELISTTSDSITKLHLMLHILFTLNRRQGILIFTKSVESAHRLAEFLIHYVELESDATVIKAISSELSTQKRQSFLSEFKQEKVNILICSDVIARGLDLGESVKMVINYDMPSRVKTYVHRIGRTARAGREGVAITILENKEVKWFKTEILAKVGRQSNVKKLKYTPEKLLQNQSVFEEALEKLKEKVKK